MVATDPPVAEALLGEDRVVAPPGRGTSTLWFTVDGPSPIDGPWLALGADPGPVVTVAPMSRVSRSYGSDGRELVAVSTAELGGSTLEADVRAQLTGWFGDLQHWTLLRRDDIFYAQPRQEPEDLTSLRRAIDLEQGLWVCGDHRDTASIQGAMVSGRRTAESILASARTPALPA